MLISPADELEHAHSSEHDVLEEHAWGLSHLEARLVALVSPWFRYFSFKGKAFVFWWVRGALIKVFFAHVNIEVIFRRDWKLSGWGWWRRLVVVSIRAKVAPILDQYQALITSLRKSRDLDKKDRRSNWRAKKEDLYVPSRGFDSPTRVGKVLCP